MAITTRAQLVAAMRAGQIVNYFKTATRAAATGNYATMFDLAGGVSGTLAGTSTTQGVVPTSATAGCPSIDSFNGLTGYIASVDLTSNASVNSSGRFSISDLLFKSGAHAFNAADTLSAQPSYSARIPGADYKGTEIWIEWVTASTGNPVVTVTYTDDKGTTGRTASFTYAGATSLGTMTRLPLASPSEGVQKIESVTCTVASAGTFNVLVLRPLIKSLQINGSNSPLALRDGPDLTSLPIIFDTSALFVHILCASTLTAAVDVNMIVAKG